jgi:hypothetical protein
VRYPIAIPALALLIAALALAGCSAGDPSPTAIASNQLPAEYAALGNSLTAAFLNGGLIEGGQAASFPRMIAAQAGWGEIAQPTVAAPGIGISGSGISTALYVDETGAITSDPLGFSEALDLLRNTLHPVPYENMGVPGATTEDVLRAWNTGTSESGANAFFDVILRNSDLPPPDSSTQFDQVKALHPRVLTLWIGANEILGGATGGNPEVGGNITSYAEWEPIYDELIDSVETIETDMVAVGTIPGITSTPFFTTVPLGYPINGAGTIPWQTEEDDVAYILLPIGSSLGAGYLPPPYGAGTDTIPGNMTLTSAEAAAVGGVIDDCNAHIEDVAAEHGWAVADIAAGLEALGADPGVLNRLFPWGGSGQNGNSVFSLDGIHPSEKGYAYVADIFISAFNETYGTAIPAVDVSSVSNVVGFESAPGFVPPHGKRGAGPLFSEEGRRVLESLAELLGNGS